MALKLDQRVYIITGGNSGMGQAMAYGFVKEGAKLIISGRDEQRGEATLSVIKKLGGQAIFISGDVAHEEHNKHLVESAEKKFGRLDGVVCNAGMLGLGKIDELDAAIWDQTFKVNVYAVYYLLKAALPWLQKSPVASVLVNASIAGLKSFPGHPAYCASKAGALALVRQAALDYGPQVRVNAICPGPVDTPLLHASAVAFPDPAQAVVKAGQNTPMQRLGTAEEVAKLALFLMSDDASWITGSAYTIDGGVMAKG